MAKQIINPGAAPTGIGGDTFRSGSAKLQLNDDEIYVQLGANAQGVLPAALPVNKGGTGAGTAVLARSNLGLGTAAIVDVGVLSGNIPVITVAGVAGFGYGGNSRMDTSGDPSAAIKNATARVEFVSPATGWVGTTAAQFSPMIRVSRNATVASELMLPYYAGSKATAMVVRALSYADGVVSGTEQTVYTSSNPIVYLAGKTETSGKIVTVEASGELRSRGFSVDANGFYKSASPIVNLFADRIELNYEAQLQEITFEKIAIGDYLVKGSSGFSQEGWYIETPKDANGNVLFSVNYKTLENGDISVKTYKKKFDLETASIIADLSKPVDITQDRWIDLRLQELPQPEVIEEVITEEMINGTE